MNCESYSNRAKTMESVALAWRDLTSQMLLVVVPFSQPSDDTCSPIRHRQRVTVTHVVLAHRFRRIKSELSATQKTPLQLQEVAATVAVAAAVAKLVVSMSFK